MARKAIISPNPASRVWQGRCGARLRSIRAPRAKCHPPRVSSAAESLVHRRRGAMPVYTVHAPATGNAGTAATDRFVFVRDGFYVWAALLGGVWLAWHRLWLGAVGWVFFVGRFGVAGTPKPRNPSNDQTAVDRGAPPPTRDVPGQPFSRPPPLSQNEIIGFFPEPGASPWAVPSSITAP